MVVTGVKQSYFEILPRNGYIFESKQVVTLITATDPVHALRLTQL